MTVEARVIRALAAALLLAASTAFAADAPPVPVSGAKLAEAAVDAFHQAMAEGYGDKLLQLMAPDVLVFETGFAERGRDQYAARHLKDDTTFAAATRSKLLRRESWEHDGMAGVVSLFEIRGDFGGHKVALQQTETMILKQAPEGWQISHVHWSAHSLGEP